jgi:hypothetical protein
MTFSKSLSLLAVSALFVASFVQADGAQPSVLEKLLNRFGTQDFRQQGTTPDDGAPCWGYITSRPSQPYFQIEVEKDQKGNPSTLDGSADDMFADKSDDGLNLLSYEESNDDLKLNYWVHSPSGHTDWGWPTPPSDRYHAIEIQFDGQKIKSMHVENSGVIFDKNNVTCNF